MYEAMVCQSQGCEVRRSTYNTENKGVYNLQTIIKTLKPCTNNSKGGPGKEHEQASLTPSDPSIPTTSMIGCPAGHVTRQLSIQPPATQLRVAL